MADTNVQNTDSIIDIIKNIENKDVVLPDFQRDFVWDESKTYDLFDSLVKDIFIGSIIYGVPSFEITVREIDDRLRRTKGKRREKLKIYSYTREDIKRKVSMRNFRIVLDGQQRITSIYRALKGFDNVWFIIKDDKELKELGDLSFNKFTLENLLFRFSGTEDVSRLSLKLSDVYSYMDEGLLEEEIIEKYFKNLYFIKNIDEDRVKEYCKKLLIVGRKLQDLFKAQKLLSYFLLDMNSEKFALFFERSNSLGVQLNFIDILVAKLNSGFRLRTEIEKLNDETDNRYQIEREVLVRAISYIVSKKLDKGYILSTLTCVDFKENWSRVCKLYIHVLDYLFNNSFIISQDWMPHSNMIIPMMIFLDSLPNSDFSQMNQNQKEFLHYWYWASVFAQRYTGGATNETIIEDSKILTSISKGIKITDSYYFRRLKISIEKTEDLYAFNKKGSSIYKGILNLINYNANGLLDWQNNSKIKLNSKIDDHHIFPQKYIEEFFKDDDESSDFVDTVVNRTLIPKITNIKIGKKSPSKYMSDLIKNNSEFKQCLESHLIPVDIIDGLYDEFFVEFLNERAKNIYDVLVQVVVKKEDVIKGIHYEEPKKIFGTNISIYASYMNVIVNATLNRETKEVLFNGEKYTSVTAAANEAKKHISGKENASTNGWTFWKYKDGNIEKKIDDFRY